MNAPRISRRGRFAVAAVVTALALAGCAGAGPTGSAPAAIPESAGTAASGALDFTAPTVDGGRFDASTLAGTPVVLWFWAPF
jgi:cytochrome oxidase Cu insertion factor (SCO1/SenC/PrrC family)